MGVGVLKGCCSDCNEGSYNEAINLLQIARPNIQGRIIELNPTSEDGVEK